MVWEWLSVETRGPQEGCKGLPDASGEPRTLTEERYDRGVATDEPCGARLIPDVNQDS